MSFLNPNGNFYPDRYYLKSLTLHHREVFELPRCPEYQQLNPHYEDNEAESFPAKKHSPYLPGPDSELIDLSSTPPGPNELNTAKSSSVPPPPARRDRGAQYISDLVVGIGERGRREAIEDAQKRKVKSGFTNSPALADKKYTFVISVAHYSYSLRPPGWKKSPQH